MKQWVGVSCKEIFSVGFSLLEAGKLTEKKVDAFCSENLLRHVLLLSQANQFVSGNFESLNKFLEQELLPCLLLKYPCLIRMRRAWSLPTVSLTAYRIA